MYYTPEIKTAAVDGIEMEYFSFGNGKKIFVMLPGLSIKSVMQSASSVASAYRQFGDDYTVYVFDRKKNIGTGYSIGNMADDTAKVMNHIGIKNCYVFGVSQGGMIAQCLAADYPELVKKLVLASTASKETAISKSAFIEWISCALRGKTNALVESFSEKLYTDDFNKKYKDFIIKLHEGTSSEELIRFCLLAAACDGLDLTDKLKKIKCPAFLIGAENDKIFTADDFNRITETLHCDSFIYETYGHAVYDEAPDFKEKIAEFFND